MQRCSPLLRANNGIHTETHKTLACSDPVTRRALTIAPWVNKGAEDIRTTGLRVRQFCAFLLHRLVPVSDANGIATPPYDLIKPRTMFKFILAWSRDTCIYNSMMVLQVI